MYSEAHLAMLAAITGFLLKTSAAFSICWLFSRIIVHPGGKFAIWFAYLLLSTCYWIGLIAAVLLPHYPLPTTSQLPLAPEHAHLGTLQLLPFWATPLSITARCLEYSYLLVLAYFICVAIKKRLHLRWILRFTYKAPEELEDVFRPLARKMGAGNVRLLMLSGIYSPATFGWIRPIVVLPPVCEEGEESDLRDIFRHELQHIRRRDFVFSGIASFCRGILFFHPAAWYAMRRLRLESELACDLAVVRDSPDKRASYAESLVNFARLRLSDEATPWNLDFAGASSQLNIRIRSILAEAKTIPRWMLGLRAACGVLLLAGFIAAAPSLFVVFSMTQPQPADSSAPLPLVQTSVSHSLGLKAYRRTPTAHARRAAGIEASDIQPAIPESAPDSNLAPPAKPRTLASTSSDPVLMRRGEPPGKTTPKQPSGTILLSSDPSSDAANATSRRASIASSITAGASEVVRLAGRDHAVKDVH